MAHVQTADVYSLVADIGGTNTRVALAEGSTLRPDTIQRYRNADHASLEAVLEKFVAERGGVDCRAASVAIAGPVHDGHGTLTNLDWTIDTDTLARATQAEFTAVLNDLEAQGHALGRIAEGNLRPVLPGQVAPAGAPQLVIGVGTGFNVAPVHCVGDQRHVAQAEAGHVSLPVRTDAELRLSRYVEAAHGFAAVEDILSGRGFERIFAWLGQEDSSGGTQPASEIMAASNDGDPKALRAVETFVRILGRVSGDLALSHLPTGGVFLAGGVARAMAPYFARFGFADAFSDKGRFRPFMNRFGVWVIEDDYAALTGSAAHLDRLAGAPNRIGRQ